MSFWYIKTNSKEIENTSSTAVFTTLNVFFSQLGNQSEIRGFPAV